MNKLEQRLIELTKQLSNARRDNDEESIEELEDEIDELEYEIEEEYNRRYETDWDD